MSKKETVGDILCKIEVLVHKLFDDHGFQWGDWLYNQFGWLRLHRPYDDERYLDGSSPEFKYGPKPDRKRIKRKLVKLLETWEGSKLEGKTADEILDLIDKEYK